VKANQPITTSLKSNFAAFEGLLLDPTYLPSVEQT
jgi:hypothetical protein